MRREEKRRKFHEALLNTLYPPPSQPQESRDEAKHVSTSSQAFDVNLIPDDYGLRLQESGGSSTSDDDDDNGGGGRGFRKLTRAQRKRLRRKKLKEDVCRRNKIIGPLLPPSRDEDQDDSFGGANADADAAVENDTPVVRQNASNDKAASDDLGEQPGGTKQNKMKHRRMAKRLSRESLKPPSDVENPVQGQSFKSSNMETGDQDTRSKLGVL